MDKFNEQYTDYTSTAPSDECRHCGRVDNQWTIKVDNSDKLKSDLRKLAEELKDDVRKAMINGDPGAVGVMHSVEKIENLLNKLENK